MKTKHKDIFKLPPQLIFKDIKNWLVAPDNSFKNDGIEEGDVLGIWWPDNADYFQDYPSDIYVILRHYENPCLKLCKYDFRIEGDKIKLIYDSKRKNTEIIDFDEAKNITDVGIVKVIIKSKIKS